MIISFACADTKALFEQKRVARFANIQTVALRKLAQLNAAAGLDFLRVPPGNRLEMLHGDRAGQHESPRVWWRLQHLREWSHEEETESIYTGRS